ncbi:MAG: tetratricopeptide repeat protein [Acidobacteria bacterium]|nr:tetratricopeptide repeat protein [Acidobacteriota bacterium]
MMIRRTYTRSARLSAFRSVVRLAFAISIGSLLWFGSQSGAAQNNQDVLALKLDKPIERELAGGESHAYQITLGAGQFLLVAVEQKGIDVVVTLFGPDDQKLVEVDSPNGAQGPEPLSAIAEASGAYRVEVRSSDKNATTGRYEVKIVEMRAATEQDHKRRAAQKLSDEAAQLRKEPSGDSLRASIEKLNQALALWRELGDTPIEAKVLGELGGIYYSLGNYGASHDYFKQALSLCKAGQECAWEAGMSGNLGLVCTALGRYQEALDYHNRAIPLLRAKKDDIGLSTAISNLGLLYWSMGEHQRAIECYNEALEVYRRFNKGPGLANIFNNLGAAYDALEEYRKAIEFYQQAIPYCDKDKQLLAQIFNNIGSAYKSLGEGQQAYDYYNKALHLLREVDDKVSMAVTLNNIGELYGDLGERGRMLEFYQQALDYFQVAGARRSVAGALTNIGAYYNGLGSTEQALDYYNRALKMYSDIGDRIGEARSLNNIGSVYRKLDNREQAFNYFDQALPKWRAVGNRSGEADTLQNLAGLRHKMGEHEQSLSYLSQALQLRRTASEPHKEITTLDRIAYVERSRGNLNEARKRFEEARELIESLRGKVIAQQMRASYFASVRSVYESYIDALMQSHKEHANEGHDAAALRMSERARARSLLETLAETRADIRQGVEARLIEQERSLQQRISAKAERVLRLKSNKRTEEQAKPLEKEIDALTIELQQIQAEIRQKSPRYAALTQPQPLTLGEIQQQLDAGTLLLEYSLGEERGFLWAVSSDSIESYELPGRAAITDAADRLLAVLSTPRGRRTGETPARQRKRASELDAKTQAAAAELSQMLLAPVASRLGKKRLVIVADGKLQHIPFTVLPSPQAERRRDKGMERQRDRETGRQGKSAIRNPRVPIRNPLIVDHEIVSLPSASTIAVLRRELGGRKPAPKMVAALADPVFDVCDTRFEEQDKCQESSSARTRSGAAQTQVSPAPASLSPLTRAIGPLRDGLGILRLPVSKEEAEAITKLAPAGTSRLAHGFDATIAAATNSEMAEYRYVHFATHGIVNNQHSELSGILLSLVDKEGREQNGFLRSGEVYNLNLPAEVVTLSACQTALGKDVRGEGLIGLTRGFMHAGAARVVASLWNVEEDGTKELMIRFYRGMLKQKLRPAAALRQAQTSMLGQPEWRSPYYWSAFILQGEWR